jgi:hypothetical protein
MSANPSIVMLGGVLKERLSVKIGSEEAPVLPDEIEIFCASHWISQSGARIPIRVEMAVVGGLSLQTSQRDFDRSKNSTGLTKINRMKTRIQIVCLGENCPKDRSVQSSTKM